MKQFNYTIDEILVELKLIARRDQRLGMSNLNGVLNYCRDINNEEETNNG